MKAAEEEQEDDLTLQPTEEGAQAAEAVEQSVARRSRRVRDLVNLGVKHFRAHRLDKAEQSWRTALELEPGCR